MAVILTDAFDTALEQFLAGYFKNLAPLERNIICAPSNTDLAFLKKNIIQNGTNLIGVEFWTPNILRTFLAQKLQIRKKIITKEQQILILSEILSNKSNTASADFYNFIRNNAEQFLEAIEEIKFANEQFSRKLASQEANLAEDFHDSLEKSNLTTSAATDFNILQISKKYKQVFAKNILFFGFSANNSNLKNLIQGIVNLSQNSDFVCIDEGDYKNFHGWISFLENISHSELQYICCDKKRKFYDLAQNFGEYVHCQAENVYFFIAKNLQLEIEIVKKRLAQITSNNNNSEIGILVPNTNSLFAKRLSQELSQLEISHYTETQQNAIFSISPEYACMTSWIDLQKKQTVGSFLSFVNSLVNSDKMCSSESLIVKKTILDMSLKCISNDINLILKFIKSQPTISADLCYIANIKILPPKILLTDFFEIFDVFLSACLHQEDIENFHSALEDFGGESVFCTENLLMFSENFCKKLQRNSDKTSKETCAKIYILNPKSAQNQKFSDIIATNCGSNNYSKDQQNIFFTQETDITRQNAIKQTIFATQNSVTFTSNLAETSIPDDLFTQTYFSITNHILDNIHKDALQSQSNIFLQTLNDSKSKYIEPQGIALKSEPLHHVHIGDIQSRKFSCKQWEAMIKDPELAYYEIVLGTGQNEPFDPATLIRISTGNITHDLLNIAHGFVKNMPSYDEFSHNILQKSTKIHNFFTKIYNPECKTIPSYIKNCIDSSSQNAKNIAKILTTNYKFITTEHELQPNATIELKSCTIPVSGRIDAIVAQEDFSHNFDTKITIIDFKTGIDDKFSAKTLQTGSGVQVALYALAMYYFGYKDIDILILKPDSDIDKIKPKPITNVLDNNAFLDLLETIYLTGMVPTNNVSDFINTKTSHRLPKCSQRSS